MIKQDVVEGHLTRFEDEYPVIRRLEADFDVTWATRVDSFNSNISVYFLKPLPHMVQSFGFQQEVLLALSEYPTPQARLIQAIEQTFERLPAKGRVDQTVALIVSKASQITEWLQDHLARNPQGRAYVGISATDFIQSGDAWHLRNAISTQLFSRDLFEYTLPLDEDMFFFGRQAIVAEHIDAIRKSENRGIFGLRKTGKTSVLFKVRRQCEQADILTLYYDCKLSSIYRLTEDEFINRICQDIEGSVGKVSGWRSKKHTADKFLNLIKNMPTSKRICIIFDEIEYISPASLTAPHWNQDFVPFWQTLWSTQSQFRRFCFVIAGVNASIVETDRYGGIQNPMFGIVKSRYLTGFEKGEVYSLLTALGKRMGMNFEDDAVELLFSRYGGHPLLTRLICSQISTEFKAANAPRPVRIDAAYIRKDMLNREQEIQFYCGHITSELEDFYVEEYDMLEVLASGNVNDFNELSQDVNLTRHLKSYGLVDFSEAFFPRFAIPVIQGYIASKWRKSNALKSNRYIVPENRRKEFVLGRSTSILRDLRLAEKRFVTQSLSPLYGPVGPTEAESFAASKVVISRDDAVSFLNQCNRSLIEPIDATGKAAGRGNYFYNDLPTVYPRLWAALNRVRAYRNYLMHVKLNPQAQTQLDNYILEDFDGMTIDSVADGWFRLQAAVLDGLVMGTQAEMAKYD